MVVEYRDAIGFFGSLSFIVFAQTSLADAVVLAAGIVAFGLFFYYVAAAVLEHKDQCRLATNAAKNKRVGCEKQPALVLIHKRMFFF